MAELAVGAELVITTLTIAAGLALGIERTLELLKHFIDSGTAGISKKEKDTRIAAVANRIKVAENALNEDVRKFVEATPVADKLGTEASAQDIAISGDREASEKYPPPDIPIIPEKPLTRLKTSKALFFQLAAAALGIISAHIFQIHLLEVLTSANGHGEARDPWFAMLDIIFSGLVIGGGSQPIHLIIRFLTERKVKVEPSEADIKKNEQVKALGKVLSEANYVQEKKEEQPLQWRDIAYRGGVKPETMDSKHIRPADPSLIVYHHTAMSSAATFQDIVDEFLNKKKWLTGYHCVIMPDGTIKPFCRWDRYGNHAKGLNSRSLGLSFHGNFHTDPKDKYSNADGRYGNQQPTEAQLHAGARVVALWVNLYKDISLDFDKCILPHKEAMPRHTVCPGSNFKYDTFKQLVTQYYETWEESIAAQKGIQTFAGLKYVYAAGKA